MSSTEVEESSAAEKGTRDVDNDTGDSGNYKRDTDNELRDDGNDTADGVNDTSDGVNDTPDGGNDTGDGGNYTGDGGNDTGDGGNDMDVCADTSGEDAPFSSTNLIVNYLPQNLSDDAFYKLFSDIGALKSHKVVRHPKTGYCFGYGFADYVEASDAAAAITKLNGLRMMNKTLKVAYARPKSEKTKNCNLYLTGLPPTTDDAKLKELFSPFGTVINVKPLVNQETMSCAGTGFVLLATTIECSAAIDALNDTRPEGFTQNLQVAFAYGSDSKFHFKPGYAAPSHQASSAGPMRSTRTNQFRNSPMAHRLEAGVVTDPSLAQRSELGVIIFIRNFPLVTDEEKLYGLFSPFGVVRKVNVMRGESGQPRGFGFVTMANDDEAVRAILKLNRSTYEGRTIEVRFKLAEGAANQGGPAFNSSQYGALTPYEQLTPMYSQPEVEEYYPEQSNHWWDGYYCNDAQDHVRPYPMRSRYMDNPVDMGGPMGYPTHSYGRPIARMRPRPAPVYHYGSQYMLPPPKKPQLAQLRFERNFY